MESQWIESVLGDISMETYPTITVVIPAYNAASIIATGLRAILAQDYPRDRMEVVVVDDGSTDNTPKILASIEGIRVIRQTNAGPARARNTGWKNGTGEIVLFTDSDCIPAPDWVRRLVEKFTAPDIGGVGGTYGIHNSDSLLARCIHEEIIERHLRMPEEVNYLGSFNLAYRRAALEATGGFDETFQNASGEDNDLSYRINKAGYRLLFTNEARVDHVHPQEFGKYLRTQSRHGYWRMKLYQTHPDMLRGDAYGSLVDYAQPPLALLILVMLPFFWLHPFLSAMFALMVGAEVLLQLPLALSVVIRCGDWRLLALAGVTFVRSFARSIGMTRGILEFGFPGTGAGGKK